VSAPHLTGWVIETLLATTLLMLLVLALRAPVRRSFGPHMAYALWLLPVFRLLLPPLPGEWTLSRFLAPLTERAATAPGFTVGVLDAGRLPPEVLDHAVGRATVHLAGRSADLAVVPPTAVSGGPSLFVLLLGAWAIGSALFLLYHLFAHRRFCARLLRRARVDRTVADGRVRVIETDAAHGPLAFGIFRRYVAFPRDFAERYDAQERDLALAHELGHHVRGDLVANWVALVVLALHWFNPVAWRAFRAFRADQEMACDALVLAGRAAALRHAYGRAIVKSAHGGAVSAACHLHTINDVKGRLRMLSRNHSNSPLRLGTGLAGTAVLGLAALGLTASGSQAAARIKAGVENTIGVRLSQDAPPAPPAPEAAPPAPAEPAAPGTRHVRTRTETTTDEDGKRVRKMIVVRVNGEQEEIDMPDVDAILAETPQVREGKCGLTATPGQATVEQRTEGKRRILIVCADRIEAMGAQAARQGIAAKRIGLQTALASIETARASILADRNLSDARRQEALAGLDEALAEIRKEAASDD
jgi:bla regulator protein blaR1